MLKRLLDNWRRVVFWLIVLELVSVLGFILVLSVGEFRRLTLLPMYLPRHPLLLAVVAGGALAKAGRRRVRELIAAHVVLGLIVLFPVMGMTVSSSQALAKPIRLTTWNVWYGRSGRAALVDQLAALPSDIIVIQAAYGSLSEVLKNRMPERFVHEEDELAIVSKFPIREAIKPPPIVENGVPALFMKYVIDTPQGPLRVISVHAYSPRHALGGADDARNNIISREGQLKAAVAAAREDAPPFIIAGDTNVPNMSAIRRRVLGDLHDAHDEVGTGFGYSFPANHPWMRIDRVLAGDGVRFGKIEVGPEASSDHRAVSVDFELTSP